MDKNKSIDNPLVRSLNQNMSNSVFTQKLFIFLIVAVVFGGITGYVFSIQGEKKEAITNGSIKSSDISKGMIVGSDDTKLFKDTAVGSLKGGGINGEGQFHLVRPGGDSQNVYLTSSTVDLSKFVGKEIKVWGQTQTAQYAGWLMDVGRIEVLK
ncbi:MAG: hypothetical protein Q8P26_01695 [Candidatus Levybacteria bacterium]|nr:hypothetical protein [Candidatus Levybacteria bacterium]